MTKTTNHEGNISDVFNAEDGSVFIQIKPLMVDGQTDWSQWDGVTQYNVISNDVGPLSDEQNLNMMQEAMLIVTSAVLYDRHPEMLAEAVEFLNAADGSGEYLLTDDTVGQAKIDASAVIKEPEGGDADNIVRVEFRKKE